MSNTQKLRRPKPEKADEEIGSGSDEDFVFETSLTEEVEDEDGNVTVVPVVLTVPSMAKITPNSTKMTRLYKQDPSGLAAADHLLDLALGDLREIVESLPGGEEQEFLKAWREHSGVGLGESRAS